MATKNKIELIEELAQKLGVTKVDAEKYLVAVQSVIVDNVVDGYDVKLSGFAHFQQVTQNPRKVHNPATGAVIDVPEKRSVRVRPMGKLKKMVEETDPKVRD